MLSATLLLRPLTAPRVVVYVALEPRVTPWLAKPLNNKNQHGRNQ